MTIIGECPLHLLVLTIVLFLLAACHFIILRKQEKDNYLEIMEDIEYMLDISRKTKQDTKPSINNNLLKTNGKLTRMLDERLIR